jgi:hypothetical protein
MTPKEFNDLDDKTKQLVLPEMCELYSIITNYPANTQDLTTFAKWQWRIGKFGDDLSGFLEGICPFK